MNIQSLVLDFV
jgi:hypothetical protein